MNLKWINNTNKISKLEKMGIKGVSDKAKDVKPAADEKKKLEEAKKEIENKYTEINAEIIKLEEEAKKVLMEKEEFETAVGSAGPVTGVAGKGGKTKTAAFKTAHNYLADLEAWHKDLFDNKLDNLYEVNWRGTKYNTIEEIGAMRIAFEVCWQIAQATDFDTKVDANTSSYISSVKSDLKTAFATIKGYADNMKDENDSGEKGGVPTSKVIGTDNNGKKIYLKVHEYVDKPYNFNFKVFFEFMEKLAPLNQISGGSQKHLIDELSGPWGTEKKKWCTWEASSTPLTKEQRDYYVKEGDAPQIWKHKDFKAYWEDTSKSKIIELDSGLRGWIELYHAIFSNRGNREKLSLVRDGESMFDSTKKITVKDSNLTRVLDLGDTTFKTNYTYESEVLVDENGTNQTVWCIYDSNDRTRLLDLRKRNLENRAESLSKNDLTIQNKLAEEKASKIREEEAKLKVKDEEIQKLVEEEIKSKQKKVTDAAIISWGDDKWSDSKNVLKAAAAKKLLLDIKWLENDGSDKGSFKKADNQTTLDAIESKRKASPQLWNAVIKQYFENLGTDLNSRITAGKADTEIGLEIIRDAYEEIGDKAVLDAINAELAKEEDSPVSDLTPETLTKLFGFTVDETLKNNWTKSDGGTIDKDKLNTIVLNEYGKSKSKFNDLMTYLNSEGDDEGKKDYEIDDDSKKSASWDKFMKEGAKTVIRTIVACERKEDLKKTIDKDNPIVKEMMSDTNAGYNTDHSECKFNKDRYGNPEEPSTIDKSKLITFLHDKKVGNIQQSSVWEEKKEEIPGGGGDEKKWYDIGTTTGKILWIGGGSVLVIGVLAAIFWKSISEWWNGPAEEQGKGQDENDEKDEENE